jgi:hypothetical protein
MTGNIIGNGDGETILGFSSLQVLKDSQQIGRQSILAA